MRVSLHWLREFVALQAPVEEIAERLTRCSLEVEAIDDLGRVLDGVVVARIKEQKPHPNADRLALCTVEDGTGERSIVCGAKNMQVGDYVALALPNTVLPNGAEIKKSKVRGEVSEGMLCSESELGLAAESQGIIVFDAESARKAGLGVPAAQLLGKDDAILHIDVLPDRGDCASTLGIARELAALFCCDLTRKSVALHEAGAPTQAAVCVNVQDAERCPRYMARLIRGLRVGKSPEWLVRRLEAVGLRSINNVVDVTNYVLWELGQPLHAFDAATIPGGEIVVRRARSGEKVALLDGGEPRALAEEDLVIADRKRPIALAGIMGGAETAVSATTTDVILEAAYFTDYTIRLSARRHALHSDSSYRFERGVDLEGVATALDRAAALIAELAGGEIAPGAIDLRSASHKGFAPVPLRVARVKGLLGIDLEPREIQRRLTSLGIQVREDGDIFLCQPPSWRHDLVREEDLLEEILRLDGYDALPEALPRIQVVHRAPSPARKQEQALRALLHAQGYSEAVNLAFVSDEDLQAVRLADRPERARAVALKNPIGAELALLRPTLLPSLLRGANWNLRHGVLGLCQFEIARIFLDAADGGLPKESRQLLALSVPDSMKTYWKRSDAQTSFFELKHLLLSAGDVLRCPLRVVAADENTASPYLHPGIAGLVVCGANALPVGEIGVLHPDVARQWELPSETVLFVLELDRLLEITPQAIRYEPAPKHPGVSRDLAILVGLDVTAAQIEERIRKSVGGRLSGLELFDRYVGKGVPDGKQSLAYRIFLQAKDKTLTDQEVTRTVEKVRAVLSQELGAEHRA